MATIEGNIRMRSRLIRHFNKMPEAEFNELEDAVFCMMADAADEFERQRGRTVGDWAIQLLDLLPLRRQMELSKESELPTRAEIDKRWEHARPMLRVYFESTLARLKTRADAIIRGERVARDLRPRAKRAKALAEFMVMAWAT